MENKFANKNANIKILHKQKPLNPSEFICPVETCFTNSFIAILLCDQVLAHLWKTDLILVFGEACSKQQKDSHLMGRAKYVCMRVDTEVVKSPISWLNTIYHNTHTHTFYLQPVFGIPTSTQQKTKRTKIFTRREGQPSHSSQSSKVSSCYKYLSFHHCKNHEGHPGRQRSGLT